MLVICSTDLYTDDQGVLSGILVNERWLNLFGHPNATMQGLVVAIFELGAWFTAYPTSWFMDRIGRRWTIMVGALIFIVGGVLQTASNTMIQLLFGRLIAGFGIGFLSTVLPVYTAELSRAHNVSLHLSIIIHMTQGLITIPYTHREARLPCLV